MFCVQAGCVTMDHSKCRKLIKDVRWSGWVWVGEFLLVPAYPGSPGSTTIKRLCVCVCLNLKWLLTSTMTTSQWLLKWLTVMKYFTKWINKISQNWPSCIFGRIEVMEIITQRIMLKLTKNLCRPQSGCKTYTITVFKSSKQTVNTQLSKIRIKQQIKNGKWH